MSKVVKITDEAALVLEKEISKPDGPTRTKYVSNAILEKAKKKNENSNN